MLSFQEKLAIMQSFPQLERRDVSLGRVNFHYERSVIEKKNVGFHFHPNGNGYIFAGEIDGVETDEKGFVNIREYTEEQLRALVEESIQSLTGDDSWEEGQEEKWFDSDRNLLVLKFEDDMWHIFSGLNLEMAFETYEEAREYLREEGFNRL
ncbi:hypothetical protein [Cohnella herbarum]|uniref:Uncharacterized protein n=1 Tax=Cohnella herbarum TaxID=2728023 RepID=A0A7Z2VLZ1_9BACL|nr:hypothetical protein [Cohnella herbarum]QJD85390.1 hypothetical protein HH215_20895 [Cohnella herbarum]